MASRIDLDWMSFSMMASLLSCFVAHPAGRTVDQHGPSSADFCSRSRRPMTGLMAVGSQFPSGCTAKEHVPSA